MNADRKFVEEHWEQVQMCRRYDGGGGVRITTQMQMGEGMWVVRVGDFFSDCNHNLIEPAQMTEADAWSAAKAYTEARLKQIADVEEEIALLEEQGRCKWAHVDADRSAFERILSREQSVLAALKSGMREE